MIAFGKTTGEALRAPFFAEMAEHEDNGMKLVVACL